MAAPETPSALGPCLSDEDIAAFLDGTLAEPERARTEAHLAGCASCYEIFAEAVAIQEELAKEGEVIPFPSRPAEQQSRRPRWWLGAAAAAAAIAVGLAVYLMSIKPMVVAGLTEGVPVQQAAAQLYEYRVYRGGNGSTDQFDSDRSGFLAGALLVDLRVSAEAGQVQAGTGIFQRVGSLLNDDAQQHDTSAAFMQGYQELLKNPSPDLLRVRTKTVLRYEPTLDESFPSCAFGKWTEATRLAAATRAPDFFADRGNRRFLGKLLKDPKEYGVEPEALPLLQEVDRMWAPKAPADYEAVAAKLLEVLRLYDT